jgi:hypothetical protein
MTAEIEKKGKTIENPSSRYASPAELVNDSTLTLEEKREALKIWEENARELAVAEEEGMSGGEPSRLAEIADAQSKLPSRGERKPSPTKSG